MGAGVVVELPDGVEPLPQVLRRGVPLGGVQHAALACRQHLAARQRDDGKSHLLVHLGGQAGHAVLEALQLLNAFQRHLEPAERLRNGGKNGERHNVHAEDVLIKLVQQLNAAALVFPAPEIDRAHAEGAAGHGGEQGRRHVLAHEVIRAGMRAVEDPAVGGVGDVKGADNRAGGKFVDLHPSPRHLLDALGEFQHVRVNHAGGGEAGLHFQYLDVILGLGLLRRRNGNKKDRGAYREESKRKLVHEKSPWSESDSWDGLSLKGTMSLSIAVQPWPPGVLTLRTGPR